VLAREFDSRSVLAETGTEICRLVASALVWRGAAGAVVPPEACPMTGARRSRRPDLDRVHGGRSGRRRSIVDAVTAVAIGSSCQLDHSDCTVVALIGERASVVDVWSRSDPVPPIEIRTTTNPANRSFDRSTTGSNIKNIKMS
jgi:hypothetical protein